MLDQGGDAAGDGGEEGQQDEQHDIAAAGAAPAARADRLSALLWPGSVVVFIVIPSNNDDIIFISKASRKRNRCGAVIAATEKSGHRPSPVNRSGGRGRGMMRFLSLLLGALLMSVTAPSASGQSGEESERPPWRLVIHGGAGVIERARMAPEEDAAIRAALEPGAGGGLGDPRARRQVARRGRGGGARARGRPPFQRRARLGLHL